MSSCFSSSDSSTEAEVEDYYPTVSDQAEIQSMIPAITASQSVVSADDSSASASLIAAPQFLGADSVSGLKFTIGAWNTDDDFPDTPEEMYNSSTFKPSGQSYARYPASGYIDDFYDVEGYQAYVELRASTDGWGDYQVKLYIYQTLSTDVMYTLEQYRVTSDDWTYLVDEDTGEYSPIAFENYDTYYFDGRVEERVIEWTRYVDGDVYEEDYFEMPSDFDDSAYTYPASITEPDKRDADDSDSIEEYAQHSTLTIEPTETSCDSATDIFCASVTGEEFYSNLINSSGERETFSKTYYETEYDLASEDYSNQEIVACAKKKTAICHIPPGNPENAHTICVSDNAVDALLAIGDEYATGQCDGVVEYYDLASETVMIYFIDSDSNQEINQKTVETHTLGDDTYTNTITTHIEIDDADADNKTNYSATITTTPSEDVTTTLLTLYDSTVEIALEETSAGNDEYSGTLSVTQSGSTTDYVVSVSYDDGLVIESAGSGSSLVKYAATDFSFGDTSHFGVAPGPAAVSLSLEHGTLEGYWKDGVLSGVFTDTEDAISGYVQAGLGYLMYSGLYYQ